MRKFGPFKLIGSALRGTFTEFLGPLFKSSLKDDQIIGAIKSQILLIAGKHDYIEFRIKEDKTQVNLLSTALSSYKFQHEKMSSLNLNLEQGEKALWASLTGRARTAIRKAQKNQLDCSLVSPTVPWIKRYYELLQLTFQRQNKDVPHPEKFYQSLIDLDNQGLAFFMQIKLGDDMLAGAIFLIDESRMIYLSGTANLQGFKLSGPSLLQWEAMKHAISLGVKDYDMNGLGIPAIDKFKLSFGGRSTQKINGSIKRNYSQVAEPISKWAISRGFIRF